MQERSNSIANALELSLFCTNPSIYARWLPDTHPDVHGGLEKHAYGWHPETYGQLAHRLTFHFDAKEMQLPTDDNYHQVVSFTNPWNDFKCFKVDSKYALERLVHRVFVPPYDIIRISYFMWRHIGLSELKQKLYMQFFLLQQVSFVKKNMMSLMTRF